ncbi:glycine-rich cell wall structural protein 1.8-like [Clarias magur]|uniref:Glycine-rich cell wall structural protein 1.8-like n=1 Tax=Clarias magur TaxID=1594786 RepID=A0A8J4U707_CLAMG|nr:glycine-rich cell wall structural protein 1.8-like [Clarias magur]
MGSGYPVRAGGQPGGYPGGYPSIGGPYPNWNPNNKILSPRYGSGIGGPGYGIGGSPFSKSVDKMGYKPSVKSKGFAKKAMLAAGVGAMTGMAVGYGLGRFPRPNFHFSSPQEEYYYNHYMHRNYGMKSTDTNDYGRDYKFKPSPKAQTYDKYMENCMKRTDLLRNQSAKISSIQGDASMAGSLTVSNSSTSESVGTPENSTSEIVVSAKSQESDDDTVSISEIGYPALIQQMKARKCVELYMAYSVSFLQKQTQERPTSRSDAHGHSIPLVLLTTTIMAFSSTILLQ